MALLPVLQKPGIGTQRIETPDSAPEFSFFYAANQHPPIRSPRTGIFSLS